MSRVQLIIPQHKALRNILSRIIYFTGNTDFHHAREFQHFKTLIHEFGVLYADHHFTEHNYVLKMAEARKTPGENFDAEIFESVNSILKLLMEKVGQLDYSSEETQLDFYHDLIGFEEVFQNYMRMQEQMNESQLQHDYTQEELRAQLELNFKRMSEPVLILWCRYLVPAVTAADAAIHLSAILRTRHQSTYDSIVRILQGELYPERFSEIMNRIKV